MINVEKKSNVLVIVLVVLVLALGGFVVYDKLLKKSDCTKEKDNKIVNLFQNMATNRKTMAEYDNGIEIIVDKDGNAYYASSEVKKAVGTKGEYKIDGYNGGVDPETNNVSDTLEGYKLSITNVVAFYYHPVGNGGWKEYVFIKEDGTIAKLTYDSFEENDKEIVQIEKFEENVSGYKNIIGIISNDSFDGHSYKLFDINGNIYE